MIRLRLETDTHCGLAEMSIFLAENDAPFLQEPHGTLCYEGNPIGTYSISANNPSNAPEIFRGTLRACVHHLVTKGMKTTC